MWISLKAFLSNVEFRLKSVGRIDVESLCIFRVMFGLFTILLFWRRYAWLGAVPDAFFKPPIFSLAALFNSFPPAAFCQFIDIAVGICTLTLTLGCLTRISTVLLLLLLLIGNSFYFSLGFINHEILYLCVLLVMCFQDWGRMFSVDALLQGRTATAETTRPMTSLWLLIILIAFGFFTSGYGKAFSWIDFDLTTSGFLAWFYDGYFTLGRNQLLAPLVLKIHAPLLWELLDISAVVFELGFLVAMWTRRSWYAWLTIACFFHLANCLLLNISFTANAVAYMAFVPWSQLSILKGATQKTQLSLTILSAFGTFAFILRMAFAQSEGFALYLFGSIGIDQLFVNCGVLALLLLLFLLSFHKFVSLPSQTMQPLVRKRKVEVF